MASQPSQPGTSVRLPSYEFDLSLGLYQNIECEI